MPLPCAGEVGDGGTLLRYGHGCLASLRRAYRDGSAPYAAAAPWCGGHLQCRSGHGGREPCGASGVGCGRQFRSSGGDSAGAAAALRPE